MWISWLSLFTLTFILVTDLDVNALSNSRAANSAIFLDNDSASLSNLASSPERFSAALNMTVDEIEETKKAHQQAAEVLHRELATDSLSGPQKHARLCQHRFVHGRNPFACTQCWSYLPVCVCSLVRSEKLSLPNNLSVVVWTHHREWGLTSNTGGLLGILLQECHVLMKGLPEHDSQFDDLIQDPDNLVLVLWPDQNAHETEGQKNSRYMSLEQVRNESKQKRIVLVAVDGTWRNARRMVARLPREKIFFTDLSEDAVQDMFVAQDSEQPDRNGGTQSLLAPLRGRGPNNGKNQVCTAEAVAGALLQLGIDEGGAEHILSVARQKVDLICRYRAKVPRATRE
jgi:hypothetical protein